MIGNGRRMNSHIVSLILNDLTGTKTPIAYFITNIYNHSNAQPQGQIDGELSIMRDVYPNNSIQKTKYYYEFDVLADKDENIIRDSKDILIDSQPYINDLTNAKKNSNKRFFELTSFIANNQNANDFAGFVTLTLHNRGFWEQILDDIIALIHLQFISVEMPAKFFVYGSTLETFWSAFHDK
ncbi:unnamed protein product [Didymodactylos carnosus]|uniref:Uncharacterized protein n=1 Tax=Didymodactylos carnosus TaxID=1234261 RepID=A0A814NH72_9BILA|nr:unnamed protein product [Didymodactylos carnosus]CAF1093580.1 unnamed protein product [Didymodactylos carnosus]CAF3729435.1 unnamed protein product [Didymodactylos carnosus]CAF3858965.1 unnamed protein product [Didymodactylos carnosus]